MKIQIGFRSEQKTWNFGERRGVPATERKGGRNRTVALLQPAEALLGMYGSYVGALRSGRSR